VDGGVISLTHGSNVREDALKYNSSSSKVMMKTDGVEEK
jgi:hypothetical protein